MKIRTVIFGSVILALCSCAKESPDTSVHEAEVDQAPEVVAPVASQPAALPRSSSADGASVFFITPAEGATVSNPIQIEFGIAGMDVVKAGEKQPHSGHHHLLIDTGLPDLGLPIPADEQHVHFGDGSTSTVISLPPGEHSLQMLLGDYLHIPHDPALVSDVLTITVE